MKKASDVEKFPYLAKELKYYEAIGNMLHELKSGDVELKDAYLRALKGESNLYATWHGVRETELFYVDDLHQFGEAFAFEQSTHEHEIIWKYSDFQGKGNYVSVEVEFACGCTFDTLDGSQRLKKELKLSKGWEMASSYLGGYKGKYIVRIKKNTIQ